MCGAFLPDMLRNIYNNLERYCLVGRRKWLLIMSTSCSFINGEQGNHKLHAYYVLSYESTGVQCVIPKSEGLENETVTISL